MKPIQIPAKLLQDAIACIARAESVGAFKDCAAPRIGAVTLAALVACKGAE